MQIGILQTGESPDALRDQGRLLILAWGFEWRDGNGRLRGARRLRTRHHTRQWI